MSKTKISRADFPIGLLLSCFLGQGALAAPHAPTGINQTQYILSQVSQLSVTSDGSKTQAKFQAQVVINDGAPSAPGSSAPAPQTVTVIIDLSSQHVTEGERQRSQDVRTVMQQVNLTQTATAPIQHHYDAHLQARSVPTSNPNAFSTIADRAGSPEACVVRSALNSMLRGGAALSASSASAAPSGGLATGSFSFHAKAILDSGQLTVQAIYGCNP